MDFRASFSNLFNDNRLSDPLGDIGDRGGLGGLREAVHRAAASQCPAYSGVWPAASVRVRTKNFNQSLTERRNIGYPSRVSYEFDNKFSRLKARGRLGSGQRLYSAVAVLGRWASGFR